MRYLQKSNFWPPSLLPQEPAGLYSKQIDQAATELERSEVARRCSTDRILRIIQAADVGAAMVPRWPRRDTSGLQVRRLQRPRPLGASFTGTWGILRPLPAVISSPVWRTARGLGWRGRLQPARDRCSNGTAEALFQDTDSTQILPPPRSSLKLGRIHTWAMRIQQER